MASKLKWAVLAVVGIVMVVFIMRSCRLYDKASELKGKHEALMLKYADLEMTMRQDLAAYQADIAALCVWLTKEEKHEQWEDALKDDAPDDWAGPC